MERLQYSFECYFGEQLKLIKIYQVPGRGDSFNVEVDGITIGIIDYRHYGWFEAIQNERVPYSQSNIRSLKDKMISVAKTDPEFKGFIETKNAIFKTYFGYDPSKLMFL